MTPGPAPDFAGEGLLRDAPTAQARDARRELLTRLWEAGVSLDDLRAAVQEGRLATLPVERVLLQGCRYSLREMMAETGLSETFVCRNLTSLGLPVPDLDAPCLDEQDLAAWRAMALVLSAGVPEDLVHAMGRVTGRAASQIAAAILDGFIEEFLEPGDTERDFGLRFAQLAGDLIPTLGPLTETPVRWHVRERVHREVIDQTALAAGRLSNTHHMFFAFVDLVDFTPFSETASVEALQDVAARLHQLSAEVVELSEHSVRLVKLVGDAAMLASPDGEMLVESTAELAARAAEEPLLPAVRAGVACGQAIERGGDWYGTPVNVASRLTAVAPPGSIYATRAVAEAASRALWTSVGEQRLKGISGQVEILRLVQPVSMHAARRVSDAAA
jgi:adenylate cyclase